MKLEKKLPASSLFKSVLDYDFYRIVWIMWMFLNQWKWHYKTYFKNTIHDDQFLTTIGVIGVIGVVGNRCSRFFWNLFFGKTCFKTVTLSSLNNLLVLSIIRFITPIEIFYLIEIFLINYCLSRLFVSTPTAALYIKGTRLAPTFTTFFGELHDCQLPRLCLCFSPF